MVLRTVLLGMGLSAGLAACGQAEVLEKPVPGAAGIVVVVGVDFEDIFDNGRPSIVTESDIVRWLVR